MLLGFCSQSGGLSAAANFYTESKVYIGSSKMDEAYQNQHSGYGFASFVYILGSLISFIVALCISPLVSSQKEKYALREPRGLVDIYRERQSIAAPERPSNA